MAAGFNINAQLKVLTPTNLAAIRSEIQKNLSGIQAKLTFDVPKNLNRSISALNRSLPDFASNLNRVTTAATSAEKALLALGAATKSLQAQNVSRIVNNNTKSLDDYSKTAKKAAADTTNFGIQAGIALRRFSAFAAGASVLVGSIQAVRVGITEAVKFQNEMVRLSQVTGRSLASLQDIGQTISDLSTKFGVSSQELSQVAVTLGQAGFSAKEVKVALDVLAKTDLAPTFDSIAKSGEGMIAIVRQFRLEAKDFESAFGAINAVAAAYAVESSDIIEAIKRTGGAFRSAGGNLNEFIALFTSVRDTTRQSAEVIATSFNTIFTRLQRPQTLKFLDQLGVKLTELGPNGQQLFVGPLESIRRLNEAISTLDTRDVKFSRIAEVLGGYRQIPRLIPLLQEFATAQGAYNVALAGTASLSKDAVTAQQSLLRQFVSLKEKFLDFVRSLGNDQTIKSFAEVLLSLANAAIATTNAIKPLLPAIAGLLAVKAFKFTEYVARGVNSGRTFLASGGVVPGYGNGDTVPAMLTPGEFVIRKKAVQAIGTDRLHALNKYASGGKVKRFAGGGLSQIDEFFAPGNSNVKTVMSAPGVKDVARPHLPKFLGKAYTQAFDHRGLLQNIANGEKQEIINYIPKGSEYIKSGLEAIVFKNKKNLITRIQSGKVERLNHEAVLQPLTSKFFPKANVTVEVLPYAPSVDDLSKQLLSTGQDARNDILQKQFRRQIVPTLSANLARSGFYAGDLHANNIGLVGGISGNTNQFRIIDPGFIRSASADMDTLDEAINKAKFDNRYYTARFGAHDGRSIGSKIALKNFGKAPFGLRGFKGFAGGGNVDPYESFNRISQRDLINLLDSNINAAILRGNSSANLTSKLINNLDLNFMSPQLEGYLHTLIPKVKSPFFNFAKLNEKLGPFIHSQQKRGIPKIASLYPSKFPLGLRQGFASGGSVGDLIDKLYTNYGIKLKYIHETDSSFEDVRAKGLHYFPMQKTIGIKNLDIFNRIDHNKLFQQAELASTRLQTTEFPDITFSKIATKEYRQKYFAAYGPNGTAPEYLKKIQQLKTNLTGGYLTTYPDKIKSFNDYFANPILLSPENQIGATNLLVTNALNKTVEKQKAENRLHNNRELIKNVLLETQRVGGIGSKTTINLLNKLSKKGGIIGTATESTLYSDLDELTTKGGNFGHKYTYLNKVLKNELGIKTGGKKKKAFSPNIITGTKTGDKIYNLLSNFKQEEVFGKKYYNLYSQIGGSTYGQFQNINALLKLLSLDNLAKEGFVPGQASDIDKAADRYSYKGDRQANGLLRAKQAKQLGLTVPATFTAPYFSYKTIKKDIGLLNRALRKAQLPFNTLLYRGLNNLDFIQKQIGVHPLSQESIGKSFKSFGLNSSSVSLFTAENFAKSASYASPSIYKPTDLLEGNTNTGAVLKILTPQDFNTASIYNSSQISGEKEFLFPSPTQFKILGHENIKPSERPRIIVQPFAKGGSVDSVPALLTPGEFVIRKEAASKIGLHNLHKLNHAEKFAKGGPVRMATGTRVRTQAFGNLGGDPVSNLDELYQVTQRQIQALDGTIDDYIAQRRAIKLVNAYYGEYGKKLSIATDAVTGEIKGLTAVHVAQRGYANYLTKKISPGGGLEPLDNQPAALRGGGGFNRFNQSALALSLVAPLLAGNVDANTPEGAAFQGGIFGLSAGATVASLLPATVNPVTGPLVIAATTLASTFAAMEEQARQVNLKKLSDNVDALTGSFEIAKGRKITKKEDLEQFNQLADNLTSSIEKNVIAQSKSSTFGAINRNLSGAFTLGQLNLAGFNDNKSGFNLGIGKDSFNESFLGSNAILFSNLLGSAAGGLRSIFTTAVFGQEAENERVGKLRRGVAAERIQRERDLLSNVAAQEAPIKSEQFARNLQFAALNKKFLTKESDLDSLGLRAEFEDLFRTIADARKIFDSQSRIQLREDILKGFVGTGKTLESASKLEEFLRNIESAQDAIFELGGAVSQFADQVNSIQIERSLGLGALNARLNSGVNLDARRTQRLEQFGTKNGEFAKGLSQLNQVIKLPQSINDFILDVQNIQANTDRAIRVASEGGFLTQGTDLDKLAGRVVGKEGLGLKTDIAKTVVRNVIGGILEQSGDSVRDADIERIKKNPKEFTQRILEGIDSKEFADKLVEVSKALDEEGRRYIEVFSQTVTLQKEYNETLSQVDDLTYQRDRAIAKFARQEETSVADNRQTLRIQRLTGGELDPTKLGAQARLVNSQLFAAQQTGDLQAQLKLGQKLGDLISALKEETDVTKGAANAMERLEKATEKTNAVRSLGRSFFGSDTQGRFQLLRDAQLVLAAKQQGSLDRFNVEQQGSIVNALSGPLGTIFPNLLDDLIGNSTGSGRIFGELTKLFKESEEGPQKEIIATYNRAIEASNQLNTVTQQNSAAIITLNNQLSSQFTTALQKYTDELTKLAKEIAVRREYNKNPDKVPNPPDVGGAVGRAYGGPIYAQRGRKLFRPKGTDTVPAMAGATPFMLTPGEFIVNRDSTQKYGPLLEMINSNRLGLRRGLNKSNLYNDILGSIATEDTTLRNQGYFNLGPGTIKQRGYGGFFNNSKWLFSKGGVVYRARGGRSTDNPAVKKIIERAKHEQALGLDTGEYYKTTTAQSNPYYGPDAKVKPYPVSTDNQQKSDSVRAAIQKKEAEIAQDEARRAKTAAEEQARDKAEEFATKNLMSRTKPLGDDVLGPRIPGRFTIDTYGSGKPKFRTRAEKAQAANEEYAKKRDVVRAQKKAEAEKSVRDYEKRRDVERPKLQDEARKMSDAIGDKLQGGLTFSKGKGFSGRSELGPYPSERGPNYGTKTPSFGSSERDIRRAINYANYKNRGKAADDKSRIDPATLLPPGTQLPGQKVTPPAQGTPNQAAPNQPGAAPAATPEQKTADLVTRFESILSKINGLQIELKVQDIKVDLSGGDLLAKLEPAMRAVVGNAIIDKINKDLIPAGNKQLDRFS